MGMASLIALIFTACEKDDAAKTYQVKFETGCEQTTDPQRVPEGDLAVKPEVELTKPDSVFEFWMLAGKEFDFSTPIFSDLNLVAKWKAEMWAANAWAVKVHYFTPAPGQFQNKVTDKTLLETAENILGNNAQFISLGTFGGYVVFDFGGAIKNADGADLAIYGNAFENSSEPAIVQVSYDENGDGLPNETWYELKGSEYDKSETIKNYEITYHKPKIGEDMHKIFWEDNQGKKDTLDFTNIKSYHSQAMFPEVSGDKISFSGTLLHNNIEYGDSPWGKIYKWLAYDWGYADNKGYEQEGDLRGSDLFELDNAVDKEGHSVQLDRVSFIKIYNATLPSAEYGITGIGERGAEISKARYLHYEE